MCSPQASKNYVIGLSLLLMAGIAYLVLTTNSSRDPVKESDKYILQIGGEDINDQKYQDRHLYVLEDDKWKQRR